MIESPGTSYTKLVASEKTKNMVILNVLIGISNKLAISSNEEMRDAKDENCSEIASLIMVKSASDKMELAKIIMEAINETT